MPKITFMGAGSTVFAKNVLGDSMMTPALEDSLIALYDIDAVRLDESFRMLEAINRNNGSKARIEKYLGTENRREALRGANYVVNAIQVGGYDPCTITDFEIPKKYGLKQTIADTLGVGGVFRALRTIPVMLDFARDMEEVCPDAWLLNYTNPMAMLTGAMLTMTGVKTVGLCHSVQVCASTLLKELGMEYDDSVRWKIAGINHQAWLLEITKDGKDLYPEIRRRALLYNAGKLDIGTFEERIAGLSQGEELPEWWIEHMKEDYKLYKETGRHGDMVRLEAVGQAGERGGLRHAHRRGLIGDQRLRAHPDDVVDVDVVAEDPFFAAFGVDDRGQVGFVEPEEIQERTVLPELILVVGIVAAGFAVAQQQDHALAYLLQQAFPAGNIDLFVEHIK